MSVIAFNFTKIAGERKSGPANKLSINNKTQLVDVREAPIGSQKALLFAFSHVTKYEPGFATMTLEGEVIVLSNEKEVQETLAQYKKNKTFGPELTQKVFNAILNRTSIESIILAKDLNLPTPFKMPRVEVAQKGTAPAKAPVKAKK
jgi:hypothetical protein